MGGFGVHILSTSSLGDRSYLATDGEVAVVVDPQRDIDRVLTLVGRLDVRITHVLETHLHNDYVSGGRELSRHTGARYLVPTGDEVQVNRTPISGGDRVLVSRRLRLRAIATPGHTFHHLSYVLDEAGPAGDWSPVGVFTGGSLLFGTTGRTDLLGPAHARDLAYAQHASAVALSGLLPDRVAIWPTHGFGSFCAANASDVSDSTLGRERADNPVLRLTADEFVARTFAGPGPYPTYYAHMAAINTAGPAPVDISPLARATADRLRDRIQAGEWVVDLRHRTMYAVRHLAGTVSLGLDGPMATWLGWLKDWLAPVTLLAETPERIVAAQRELVRIGIDRPAAAAAGEPGEWAEAGISLRELMVADFAALAAVRAGGAVPGQPAAAIVDVRMPAEWRRGHLSGAIHLPLPEVPGRVSDLPAGVLWVHCGSGYRAALASSLLANAGRQVVLIDDTFDRARLVGLPMVDGR